MTFTAPPIALKLPQSIDVILELPMMTSLNVMTGGWEEYLV